MSLVRAITVTHAVNIFRQVLPLYVSSLSSEEEQQVASVQAEPASETLAQVSTLWEICCPRYFKLGWEQGYPQANIFNIYCV